LWLGLLLGVLLCGSPETPAAVTIDAAAVEAGAPPVPPPGSAPAPLLRIGSKRFTESYVLGELLRQQAASAGPAIHRAGLGNTAILLAALQSDQIDVYPEYTGTIVREILGREDLESIEAMRAPLAAMGLGVGVPLGFNDAYALAVPATLAKRLGLRTLADLATHPELRLGLSQEFLQRRDGWPNIVRRYQLNLPTPHGLDHGLAYQALSSDAVDVIDAYTTDARLARTGLIVLDDPLHALPPYQAVLLYRLGVPERAPGAWRALTALTGRIDAEAMRLANAQVDLDHRSFAAAASALRARLDQDGRRSSATTVTPPEREAADQSSAPQAGLGARLLSTLLSRETLHLLGQHLALVGGPVLLAILVGLPLGMLAAYVPRLGAPVLVVTGVLQTVPALALLALLIAVTGTIGMLPALVALFIYALLPIVSATQVGLVGIDRDLREAAVALGAPWLLRVRYIELPAARRTILAGVRTAAVINVGGATLAAFVGAGGLGERIVSGLAVNDPALLLAGAIPAALLAVLIEWGFR
jgi:osmoprotectant transport system permease protein